METYYPITDEWKSIKQTQDEELLSGIKGTILGAAIGDAAGVPYEVFGELMSSLKKKTAYPYQPLLENGYLPSGTHDVMGGTWSDDTSMGLCLAMSLLQSNGFNETNCADWFASWMFNSTLSSMPYTWGIGAQTGAVLRPYLMGESLESIHKKVKGRPTNGGVMRNFSVAPYFHTSLEEAIKATIGQIEVTHPGKDCEVAIKMGCVQTEIIWRSLHNTTNKTISEIIKETLKPHMDKKDPIILSLYEAGFNRKLIKGVSPRLYVGSAFTAMSYSIMGLLHAETQNDNNYVKGLDFVIEQGGDTDTNGCIYGAMAGAYYKYETFPKILTKYVVYRNFLETIAVSLMCNKDMVTDKFVVSTKFWDKYEDNIAPKHTLVKPNLSEVSHRYRKKFNMDWFEELGRM